MPAEQVTITIHKISEDGYPDMDALVGQVAFIWDGYVVCGWPLRVDNNDRSSPFTGEWEAADDKLSSVRAFAGVTHWIEFPEPVWNYETPGRTGFASVMHWIEFPKPVWDYETPGRTGS